MDEKEEEVKGDVVDNWMLDKIYMYFQTSWWQKGNSLGKPIIYILKLYHTMVFLITSNKGLKKSDNILV